MKRGWKIFWIVCASLAAIGLICCAASFALGVTVEAIESRYPNGFTIFSWNDRDDDYFDDSDDDSDDGDLDEDMDDDAHHEEDSHEGSDSSDAKKTGDGEIFEGIVSVDGDISAGEVEVRTSEELTDEIKIVTENIDERLKLKYYKKGGEFKITTNRKITGIVGMKTGKICIYVPAGYTFEEFSLEMAAGTLYIEDIQARELSVDIGAGEADIRHFHANEAEFDCGAGEMKVTGAAEKEADLDCGIGEISYTTPGKESDYNYEINCGIGEITCGSASYSGLGKEKSIYNHAAKEMNIDCGVGTVTVKFAEQL